MSIIPPAGVCMSSMQVDQHLIAFLSFWVIESTLRIIDIRAVVLPEQACSMQVGGTPDLKCERVWVGEGHTFDND
jgi:hypothetical protein